jgi:hypothetical protein
MLWVAGLNAGVLFPLVLYSKTEGEQRAGEPVAEMMKLSVALLIFCWGVIMPDDDAKLTTKAEATLSKKDVEEAKRRAEIAAIERQAKIDAWNDYIEFAAAKSLGLAGLIVGGLEYLEPHLLPIVLKRPDVIAGLGVGLLFGKKGVLSFLAKISRMLEKMLEEKS